MRFIALLACLLLLTANIAFASNVATQHGFFMTTHSIHNEASSWWKLESDGTDGMGVVTLDDVGTVTHSGGGATSDGLGGDNGHSGADNSYYNMNDFSVVLDLEVNDITTAGDLFVLGDGAGFAKTNYAYVVYGDYPNSELEVWVSDESTVSVTTLTGITWVADTRYIIIATYDRVGGAADNGVTLYIAPKNTCSFSSTTASDANLMVQDAGNKIRSLRATTKGSDATRYNQLLYNNTILSSNQIKEFCGLAL